MVLLQKTGKSARPTIPRVPNLSRVCDEKSEPSVDSLLF
jgi:hypothetical protein